MTRCHTSAAAATVTATAAGWVAVTGAAGAGLVRAGRSCAVGAACKSDLQAYNTAAA